MTLTPPPETRPPTELPRVLGGLAAACVVVGSVIGSGIFIKPATIAANVPYIGGIAAVWIIGGLFSLAGALTLAELGAMLPNAGGPYVYLREAFGRLPAFLFGWTELLVIRTGSIATMASGFGLYFALLVPPPSGLAVLVWQTAAAVAATLALALVNVVGTRTGGGVQVAGTALKVGSLAAMIVLPFLLGRADWHLLTPVWPAETATTGSIGRGLLVAMVSVLWAYDGWVNAANLAEEVRDPGRNIPRALIGGTVLMIALYLGVTLIYHMVLPLGEIASASTEKGSARIVAADFFLKLMGPPGLTVISLVVMASILISLNGNALSGPRAYFAMARDGLFPAGLCQIHPRFLTPANAVMIQAAWSVFLLVAGAALLLVEPPTTGYPGFVLQTWATLHRTPLYDVMSTYVIFGATVFYTLAIVSVFTLRRIRPDLARPYRTWGYPVTPAVYTVAALVLLGSMLVETPTESIAGLAIIAAGVPAYALFNRQLPSPVLVAGSEPSTVT